jgi:AraC family transcriptional regulator
METYYQRFNEVLKYIHFHLDEKLDLDKLASIAFVSKHHFHRMIKAYLGEALGTYINRIKVETGAKLLKYSNNPISEIAYKIGYETPTSFNKSFKKQFGVTPTQFRKNPNHSFDIIKNKTDKTTFDLEVETKVIQPILVLSNQTKGLVDKAEIWKELMEFATQHNLISEQTKMYGITWDDPSITSVQHIRYDACISIQKEILHNRFAIKKIAGGKYMCFTYQGNYKYIGDVYDQIFRDYILPKKISLREEPLFDQFLNDINNTIVDDLLTMIYVPIQ